MSRGWPRPSRRHAPVPKDARETPGAPARRWRLEPRRPRPVRASWGEPGIREARASRLAPSSAKSPLRRSASLPANGLLPASTWRAARGRSPFPRGPLRRRPRQDAGVNCPPHGLAPRQPGLALAPVTNTYKAAPPSSGAARRAWSSASRPRCGRGRPGAGAPEEGPRLPPPGRTSPAPQLVTPCRQSSPASPGALPPPKEPRSA